jgi:hypothetical protein
MSEPDSSSPRRRPPTIDLTAEEVQTEQAQPAGGDAGAAQKAASRNRGGPIAPSAIAALAGAVAALAVIAALWAAGVIPPSRAPEPQQAVKLPPDISAQLNKIESELQTRAPAPDPALMSRLAAAEAQTKTLSDSLAGLNKRIDDVAVAAKSAGERADAASAAAKGAGERADAAAAAAKSAGERADAAAAAAKQVAQSAQAAAQSAVQRSDLEALQNRIAALERQITAVGNAAALKEQPRTDDRAARAALAAAALRDAVERGAPYQTELAAVKALGAPQAATAPLEPFAANGIPSTAALAHELAQLTPSLQHASGAPPAKTSFLARLEDNAKNLVRVTPVDAPVGDDPAAVIARLNVDAAHADLAAALADIARLPKEAQTLAAPWVQRVNARNAALAAARRVATDSLAGLGQPNSQ